MSTFFYFDRKKVHINSVDSTGAKIASHMVIVNNTITYENYPSALLWRPRTEIISALCTAVVTTLLSYQLTATFHHLFFGIKRHGNARISDLFIFLLMNSFSPSFVFRSIYPGKQAFEKTSRHYKIAVVKIFALLLIGPAISIFTIASSLETSTILTFADAGFSGMAVGFDPSASTPPSEQASARMSRFDLRTAWEDTVLVGFIFRDGIPGFLQSHEIGIGPGTWNETATVLVGTYKHCSILVHLQAPSIEAYSAGSGWAVWHNKDATTEYCIAPRINGKDLDDLAEHAAELIWRWCSGSGPLAKRYVPKGSLNGDEDLVSLEMVCHQEGSLNDLAGLIDNISSTLTFTNSPSLLLAPKDMVDDEAKFGWKPEDIFFDGMNLEFLRRRKSRVSLLLMVTFLGASMILRLSVAAITSNDVAEGIELICRDILKLSWCDSMMAGRVDVEFEPGSLFVEVTPDKPRQSDSTLRDNDITRSSCIKTGLANFSQEHCMHGLKGPT